MTRANQSLSAHLLRASLTASLALSCALGAGSCTSGPELAPAVSPAASTAKPRRRTPPQPERCAAETVVVEAPVCG